MVVNDVLKNFLRDAAVFEFSTQNGMQNLLNEDLLLLLDLDQGENHTEQKNSLVIIKAKVNADAHHLRVLFLVHCELRDNQEYLLF